MSLHIDAMVDALLALRRTTEGLRGRALNLREACLPVGETTERACKTAETIARKSEIALAKAQEEYDAAYTAWYTRAEIREPVALPTLADERDEADLLGRYAGAKLSAQSETYCTVNAEVEAAIVLLDEVIEHTRRRHLRVAKSMRTFVNNLLFQYFDDEDLHASHAYKARTFLLVPEHIDIVLLPDGWALRGWSPVHGMLRIRPKRYTTPALAEQAREKENLAHLYGGVH